MVRTSPLPLQTEDVVIMPTLTPAKLKRLTEVKAELRIFQMTPYKTPQGTNCRTTNRRFLKCGFRGEVMPLKCVCMQRLRLRIWAVREEDMFLYKISHVNQMF